MKFVLPLSLLFLASCSSVKTNEANVQLLSKYPVLNRSVASDDGVVESIRQAFMSRMTQVRGCYQDEMRRSKKIDNALVRVNFLVNNGQISNFKTKGLNPFSENLGECLKTEIATAFLGFNTNGSDIEIKQPFNFHPYDDGKLEETRKHYSEGVVESAIQNKHFVIYFPHSKGRGQGVPKGCDNTKAGIRCRLHSQLPCKLETGEQVFHLGMFEYQIHTYGKTRGVDPHIEVFSLVSDQNCRLAL